VEQLLIDIKSKQGIPEERFYNLMIALTEALNNAIIHGNKNNPGNKIVLDILIEGSVITVRVCDQGQGFDPNKVADPREPENLLKASGRGVFLIRTLMDEVFYNITDSGTELVMKYDIADEAHGG
jgi:serine/threonine-protein kinase RsbW